MSRPTASLRLALSFLLATLGCSGDGGSGPAPPPVLRVEITTTGGDLDLDGYTLAIDGGAPQVLLTNHDVLVFEALAPGPHTVELDGIAGNCAATEGDLRPVTLTPADTTLVAFDVRCTVNGVSVAVTTTGLDQDLWHNLVVDGIAQPASFFAAAGTTVSRLTPGDHLFRLDRVAPNCRAEPEQQTVTVVAGSIVPMAFVVSCVAASAVLRVTATTAGQDQDKSGYTLAVSGKTLKMKGNDVAYLQDVPVGRWTVALRDVASNCTPDGTSRVIDVVGGGLVRDTVDVAFEVSCVRAWELAFTRGGPGPGPFGIWVGRLNGSVLELATESIANPAWSPDGLTLGFSCGQVCILPLDGTPMKTLPTGYSTDGVSWSPDGTQLVFGSYTCPEYCYYNEEFQGLTIVQASDGSDSQQIPLPPDVSWAAQPDWSPDGATIAFECRMASGTGVCTVHPDGSGFRRLTNDHAWSPAWSPDGSRIAFSRNLVNEGPAVWVMNADGTGARQVTDDGRDPAWTRDGQRIVFSVWHCDAPCDLNGLHWVRLDGSERARLTNGLDFYPAIRP